MCAVNTQFTATGGVILTKYSYNQPAYQGRVSSNTTIQVSLVYGI